MRKTSPTQRSMQLMRDRGYFVTVVEKWVDFKDKRGIPLRISKPGVKPGVRKDTLGCDILAVRYDLPPVLVQTGVAGDLAAHEAKLLETDGLPRWLSHRAVLCPHCKQLHRVPNGRVEVHGWRAAQHQKAKVWRVNASEVEAPPDAGGALVVSELQFENTYVRV